MTSLMIVDNFADAGKFFNLHGERFNYMDKRECRRALTENTPRIPRVEAVIHQDTCFNTLVHDGLYMIENNFTCSKEILEATVPRLNGPRLYTHAWKPDTAQCPRLFKTNVRPPPSPPDRAKSRADKQSDCDTLTRTAHRDEWHRFSKEIREHH